MASIAMMIVAAVVNAATFTGGNYLARYLAGDSCQAALDEKFSIFMCHYKRFFVFHFSAYLPFMLLQPT